MPASSAYSRFDRLLALRAWLAARLARQSNTQPARLTAEVLEDRLVPDGRPLPLPMVFLGSGGGPGSTPVVQAHDAETGVLSYERMIYEPTFTGGVRVAAGDLTRDGFPDVIVAPGPGGGPRVRVLDGKTGEQISGPLGNFWAFDPAFTGGVNVAAADVNRDGTPDVVVTAGAGGGPHVKVFSGATGAVLASFFALDPDFGGGLSVAAADLTGDGQAEIAVGAGEGGGPRVKVYDPTTWAPIGGPLGDFFAFAPEFHGGVYLGSDALAGDLTGDGVSDLAVGSGPGMAAAVRVYDGVTGAVARELAPFGTFDGGVRVGLAYIDDDQYADVVAGTGPGTTATVKVFSGLTGLQLPPPMGEYTPFGTETGGVYVGASNDPAPPVMTIEVNGSTASPTLVAGQAFTVAARVTPSGGFTPTGTVEFEAWDILGGLTIPLGTQSLGVATAPAAVTPEFSATLPVGGWEIHANYLGDSHYPTGAVALFAVTVSPPPPPASIGDYVWYDTNRDGVQDPGESPAAGVSVTLTGGDLTGPISTTTDGTGHYLFSGLAAGTYTVSFTPPSGYYLSSPRSGEWTIPVDAGETYEAADAGLRTNQPPVAVDDNAVYAGDALSIDVLGNDSDPDDDPIAITAWTQPAGGEVILIGNVLQYTPSDSFIGTDTFEYTISDGIAMDSATVTVTVPPRVGIRWDKDAKQWSDVVGGPVNGVFRLDRNGSTDDYLAVGYSVDLTSTAAVGVDYYALTGTATFAPGEATISVPVVPTGTVMSAPLKTVDLTVVPGSGYTTLASAISTSVNILQDANNITVTMRYNSIVPVNANNDNKSLWTQGNAFIPTVRDFDATNLDARDPQLIPATVTITGGAAGTLSFERYEPGEAETVFWVDQFKRQTLADYLSANSVPAGQDITLNFFIEGRHESSYLQDYSFVTWTFTPTNPNIQPVSSPRYGILVTPIINTDANGAPMITITRSVVSFANGQNGRRGILAARTDATGAVLNEGITIKTRVTTGGLNVGYVQNQLTMQNGYNAGGPGLILNPNTRQNFAINLALMSQFPLVDGDRADALYEEMESTPVVGPRLITVDIEMVDSPSVIFEQGGERVSRIDLKRSFRSYIVVRYSDGSIYAVGSISWSANLYGTMWAANQGVTQIPIPNGITLDDPFNRSNDNPQTSGVRVNSGNTVRVPAP